MSEAETPTTLSCVPYDSYRDFLMVAARSPLRIEVEAPDSLGVGELVSVVLMGDSDSDPPAEVERLPLCVIRELLNEDTALQLRTVLIALVGFRQGNLSRQNALALLIQAFLWKGHETARREGTPSPIEASEEERQRVEMLSVKEIASIARTPRWSLDQVLRFSQHGGMTIAQILALWARECVPDYFWLPPRRHAVALLEKAQELARQGVSEALAAFRSLLGDSAPLLHGGERKPVSQAAEERAVAPNRLIQKKGLGGERVWEVAFEGKLLHDNMRHYDGFDYLTVLLTSVGRAYSVVDLALTAGHGCQGGDFSGAAKEMDGQAPEEHSADGLHVVRQLAYDDSLSEETRAEYKSRLRDLQAEKEGATDAEKDRLERAEEFLVGALSRRPVAAPEVKKLARDIYVLVKRAAAALGKLSPELGEHLKPGMNREIEIRAFHCRYRPRAELKWDARRAT